MGGGVSLAWHHWAFAGLLTLVGIARLSSNWIVKKLAAVYVEAVRNIPLALFLTASVLVVVLGVFPQITDAWDLAGLAIISNRGVAVAWYDGSGAGLLLLVALLSVLPVLDQQAARNYETLFQRALVTFALARGLNGVISVAQGTEVAVEPGGMGVNFTVGEILEAHPDTAGLTVPGNDVAIFDDAGRRLPDGEDGNICVRGPNVMLGYWGEGSPGRWMHTGDIATMDEAGYVRIVGRSKDMLIRGGENIYPREIEEFLYTNPKVDQVEVVGVPDQKFGEEIAACIRLHEGETATTDEIRDFCRGKLAHFKIPRYVKFVEEFPLTVTGKVQKFILREQLTEELEQSNRASQPMGAVK